MIGACALRLLLKGYFDNHWIYESFIVTLCHFFMATGIIMGIKWLRAWKPTGFDRMMSSSAIHWLDAISVYVYCFHGLFIAGPLSVFALNLNKVFSVALVYLLTFVLATIVYIPFETIGRMLSHHSIKR